MICPLVMTAAVFVGRRRSRCCAAGRCQCWMWMWCRCRCFDSLTRVESIEQARRYSPLVPPRSIQLFTCCFCTFISDKKRNKCK